MAKGSVKNFVITTVFSLILLEGVNSVNNFAPSFDYFPSVINVPETTTFGDIIWRCNATDGDDSSTPAGQLRYQMNTNVFVPRWVLDSVYCIMYVNTKLDYESKLTHVLRVVVQDLDPIAPKTTTGTLTINIIDINDNIPECREYNRVLYVPEDKAARSVIAKAVCSDNDREKSSHGKVLYQISDSNSVEVNNTFEISFDGSVTVMKRLDYERVNFYVLTIDVYDNAGEASLTTSITYVIQVQDVDDNKPTWPINPLTVYIQESTSLGTVAFTLTAEDADKPMTDASKITYGIKTRAVPDWFGIDSHTGAVYVKGILDRYISTCVTMEVYAYSSNKSTYRSDLVVDIRLTYGNTTAAQQNCDIPTTASIVTYPETSTRTSSTETSTKPTEKPTAKPTEKPTEKITTKPTEKPTAKPTEKITTKPTEKITEKPTAGKSTEKLTKKPTAAKPTEKNPTKPTAKSTDERPRVSEKPTANEQTKVNKKAISDKEDSEFMKGFGTGIGSTAAFLIIVILILVIIYKYRKTRVYKF